MSTGAILDHVAADQATEGSQIEYRGWRGRLTTGVNPFGTSGRERCIVHDRWGIRYLHDPVSDLVFCSPRFSQESLEACYQSPTAHTDVRTFENFDRALWESSRRRSYLVSRLKMNLINRYLSPGARVLDVGCHMGLFVLLCQEAGNVRRVYIGKVRLGRPHHARDNVRFRCLRHRAPQFAPSFIDRRMP